MCRGVACFEADQGFTDVNFVRTWLYGHIAYPVFLQEVKIIVPSVIPKMETENI